MIALFLINAPLVAAHALRLLVAGWFAIDAARYAIGALRAGDRTDRVWKALAALGNLAVVLLLLLARRALMWVVTIAGALRIFGIAWSIGTAPIHTQDAADDWSSASSDCSDAGGGRHAAEISAAEGARAPSDRGWTVAFIATPSPFTSGRMSTDLTPRPHVARRRRSWRHAHRRDLRAVRDESRAPHVARADALDRAARVALAHSAPARCTWRVDRPPVRCMASLADVVCDPDS
jgi:hypothetical protein